MHVVLQSTIHQTGKCDSIEMVVVNSKSKVIWTGMRSFSESSKNISPQNFTMSIVDNRVFMNVVVCRAMHTTKDARPTNEFMHTMGGRPAIKDSFEHMSLDVGEKGGGGKFHKEIGPVEVGEGGGGHRRSSRLWFLSLG